MQNQTAVFSISPELVLPRKSDALDHLDLNYAAPPREAKVVLIRGDKSPPVVEEYVIGPLSNISGHRMTNTMFHKSPTAVPYLFRPVTDVEYREVMKLLKVVDSQLKHVLIESYEASFFNCADQCLVMKYYTVVSPKSSGQNKRLLWYWAHHDVEPYMLNPVDFAILFNLDGPKSQRYKVEKIWYSGQDFYSAKQLVSYYEVDAMKKSSILFPRTSSKHYFYDSSNFDRFQNRPLRSPKQVMPDGPRFSVKHGNVLYLNWEFYVRMSSQNGPQLFNIKHNNKRLVYELSLQEIASFHSGYNPWIRFSNIIHSSRLLGLHAKHLQPGVDCPYHALFIPSVHLHQSLQHTISNNSFCIFEHSTGYPLRRHSAFTNEFNYKYSGLEDIVLTIRCIITIHNSDYIIDFIFHQNGVIEVKTGISGYPMVTVNSPQEARYGYKVHRNIYSGIEQNMFHFKVDIDVLGIKNRMKTIDIVEHSIRNGDWSSDDSSRFQQLKLTEDLKMREKASVFRHNGSSPQYVVFYNNGIRSDLKNTKGYRLTTDNSNGHVLSENSGNEASVSWARYDIAVTKRKETEQRSSSIYAMWDSKQQTTHFQDFLEDNDSILDEVGHQEIRFLTVFNSKILELIH